MLKCYYAHTMVSYGSTIEEQDINLLKFLGFEVINPSDPKISKECDEYIESFGKDNVMKYFENIINDCDVIAFRSSPDGSILSGIAAEIKHSLKIGIPVIELPCNLENRMKTYPETKKYLTELGYYKIKKNA